MLANVDYIADTRTHPCKEIFAASQPPTSANVWHNQQSCKKRARELAFEFQNGCGGQGLPHRFHRYVFSCAEAVKSCIDKFILKCSADSTIREQRLLLQPVTLTADHASQALWEFVAEAVHIAFLVHLSDYCWWAECCNYKSARTQAEALPRSTNAFGKASLASILARVHIVPQQGGPAKQNHTKFHTQHRTRTQLDSKI